MKNAALLAFAILLPVIGQAATHRLSDIATRKEAPSAVAAAHAHAQAMGRIHVNQTLPPSAPTCNDFLVAPPAVAFGLAQQSVVYLAAGCDIPAGSWLIEATATDYNGTSTSFWNTDFDIPQGDHVYWQPDSGTTGSINLIILPPSLIGRQLQTSFSESSPFQIAYEGMSTTGTATPTRQILVEGVYDKNIRVLFGSTDVTSQTTWLGGSAANTIVIDVTDIEAQNQGSMVPLTVVQSGFQNDTVLILHGIPPGKG